MEEFLLHSKIVDFGWRAGFRFCLEERSRWREIDADDLKRRKARALDWKQFRQDFLFSQVQLAEVLGCCLRTVINIGDRAGDLAQLRPPAALP